VLNRFKDAAPFVMPGGEWASRRAAHSKPVPMLASRCLRFTEAADIHRRRPRREIAVDASHAAPGGNRAFLTRPSITAVRGKLASTTRGWQARRRPASDPVGPPERICCIDGKRWWGVPGKAPTGVPRPWHCSAEGVRR